MMYRVLSVLLCVLCFSSCGGEDDGDCLVPIGVYTLEVSDAGGTCSQSIVNSVTAIRRDITVTATEPCGTLVVTETDSQGECTLALQMVLQSTADGIENGSMHLSITGCDPPCEHDFNLWLEGH